MPGESTLNYMGFRGKVGGAKNILVQLGGKWRERHAVGENILPQLRCLCVCVCVCHKIDWCNKGGCVGGS